MKLVSGTRIFARRSGARQILVYSMNLESEGELAMILPLPTSGEAKFINLERYPKLFSDMERGFPAVMIPAPASRGGGGGGIIDTTLPVHEVGSFEASFVPSLADFARLDERFRLPATVWPESYRDYGFAVFKLKPLPKRWGLFARKRQTVHPMAFEFESRAPEKLFFPTLHIHDGTLHETAEFDHQLYHQSEKSLTCDRSPQFPGYETSTGPASDTVDVERAAGVIDGALPLRRVTLRGSLENRDTWMSPE